MESRKERYIPHIKFFVVGRVHSFDWCLAARPIIDSCHKLVYCNKHIEIINNDKLTYKCITIVDALCYVLEGKKNPSSSSLTYLI